MFGMLKDMLKEPAWWYLMALYLFIMVTLAWA